MSKPQEDPWYQKCLIGARASFVALVRWAQRGFPTGIRILEGLGKLLRIICSCIIVYATFQIGSVSLTPPNQTQLQSLQSAFPTLPNFAVWVFGFAVFVMLWPQLSEFLQYVASKMTVPAFKLPFPQAMALWSQSLEVVADPSKKLNDISKVVGNSVREIICEMHGLEKNDEYPVVEIYLIGPNGTDPARPNGSFVVEKRIYSSRASSPNYNHYFRDTSPAHKLLASYFDASDPKLDESLYFSTVESSEFERHWKGKKGRGFDCFDGSYILSAVTLPLESVDHNTAVDQICDVAEPFALIFVRHKSFVLQKGAEAEYRKLMASISVPLSIQRQLDLALDNSRAKIQLSNATTQQFAAQTPNNTPNVL